MTETVRKSTMKCYDTETGEREQNNLEVLKNTIPL